MQNSVRRSRILYHHTVLPITRLVRTVLREKGLDFTMISTLFWEEPLGLLTLNRSDELPVLVEADNETVIVGYSILEYLEEVYPEPRLLPDTSLERAEVRRLLSWFLHTFQQEVTAPLINERVIKRLQKDVSPEQKVVRVAKERLSEHLHYIGELSERRLWLGGEGFSYADLAAAVQISVCDFIDFIVWERCERVKDWYVRIKSRPSFRPLLEDRIMGFPVPVHYADLDF